MYLQLGGSGEFKENCLSVIWGGPHVLSLLGCFPLDLLFTTHCFLCHGRDLSFLVGVIEAVAASWVPCIVQLCAAC